MTRQPEDQAKRALEILAASVKVPTPPAGIAEATAARRRPYALAAMVIIFIGAAAWQLLRPGLARLERQAPDVVVEHLRIHGKTVQEIGCPVQRVQHPKKVSTGRFRRVGVLFSFFSLFLRLLLTQY